jgi:hypothetical protein
VLHFHPRRIAQLHRLLRDRKRAGDHRLRCDDRRHRRERDQRVERPRRRQQVERIRDRRRIDDQQRALAEIVERERRQHERAPREAHGSAAEVPHVRVERLGAGHHEHDRAQRKEPERAVRREESDGVQRIERQDLGRARMPITPAGAASRTRRS